MSYWRGVTGLQRGGEGVGGRGFDGVSRYLAGGNPTTTPISHHSFLDIASTCFIVYIAKRPSLYGTKTHPVGSQRSSHPAQKGKPTQNLPPPPSRNPDEGSHSPFQVLQLGVEVIYSQRRKSAKIKAFKYINQNILPPCPSPPFTFHATFASYISVLTTSPPYSNPPNTISK